jgi:hypothetical protein
VETDRDRLIAAQLDAGTRTYNPVALLPWLGELAERPA